MYLQQMIELFTQLNYPETLIKENLLPILQGRVFHERKTLLHKNEIPKELHFVAKGYGRVSYLNDDQQTITARFVKPVESLNLNQDFLKQIPSPVRLEVYKESYVYTITYENFSKLYDNDHQFKKAITLLLAKQLYDKARDAEILKISKLKFARILAYLPYYPDLKTHASNPEIASKLGISSTTVWRYFNNKK
ncbi:hypothetical protein SAMN05216436_11149 [bacterium A37T11]|nr:hypothetical protein SAMN05216436_11149 [bacterium A37T11]